MVLKINNKNSYFNIINSQFMPSWGINNGRIYSNLLIRNPPPPPLSHSILFNDFLCLPNAFWQFPEGELAAFNQRWPYTGMNTSILQSSVCCKHWSVFLIMIGFCWLINSASFLQWNSLCMIVEHHCKIVRLKCFFLLFDAEGLTPKSDI